MSRYFQYFPKVQYDDRQVVDITRRVALVENLLSDPYAFMPYTIEHDESPEDVAYFYYGDAARVWMIYLANNIIDPYTQWPLSDENFEKTLIRKYAAQANTTGYGVITWTMNNSLTENVLYYENVTDKTLRITNETFELDPTIIGSDWTPVRIYGHEFKLNEAKRSIFLINNAYANQVENDFIGLMNG